MEMEMSKCRKEAEDEQRMRQGKSKKVDLFVFLSDDILLDILKKVPDVFLRYKAKYVCKRWLDLIRNIILLDHASFILQNVGPFTARLVDIREEGEEGLQVKVQYPDNIPCIGKIRYWCNEFILISNSKEGKRCLYVYNLITKEGSYLPECNSCCGGHYTSKCGVALSFDRLKGIYKVVHLFMGGRSTIECHILILSDVTPIITSDSSNWKKIEVPYEGQYIYGDPVSVQGRYLNWIIRHSDHLVSVDTVKEKVCIISLPDSSDREGHIWSLFVMGGFLALFNEVSREEIELWVLKDFHRVKWEKLQTITNGGHYFYSYPGRVIYYRIYGMVRKRYIIMKSKVGMYSYDLKSGVAKKLDIHNQLDDEHCVFHSTAPSLI